MIMSCYSRIFLDRASQLEHLQYQIGTGSARDARQITDASMRAKMLRDKPLSGQDQIGLLQARAPAASTTVTRR